MELSKLKSLNLGRIFSKLSRAQKIVFFSFVSLTVFLFFLIGQKSSKPDQYPLYGINYKLSTKDIARIESSLTNMGVTFSKTNDQIFVSNEATAMKVKTQLGMDGLIPEGIKGWELFDNQPFTTTDFERKINVRRAITDSIKKHLEVIDGVRSADVVVSFGDNKYFADDIANSPLTASIVLTTEPNSDLISNKNKIRGLRDLIAKGVAELDPQNVVIMDSQGNVLTKSLEVNIQDSNVQLAKEHLEIKEQERMKIYQELKKHLETVFTGDRFDVKVNLELNWDVEKTQQHLILPTIIKEDNPNTPYDDSQTKESVTVSSKKTQETFKGQGYIPEGPAGIEDQVPPGLKEKMDKYNTYEKNEVLNNEEFSKADKEIIRQPYIISKINVSVFLDGQWNIQKDSKGNVVLENGAIKRTFTPVDNAQIKSVETSIRSLVGYNPNRGDAVSVTGIQFDRSASFLQEDDILVSKIQRRNFFFIVGLVILAIFVFLILYHNIRKELIRRRRIREEELLMEQEAKRLASLEAKAEEFNLDGLGNETVKHAVHITSQHPDNVAKLIRIWLNSEE